jgi:DNA repair protein RadA/Sms
MRLFMIEIRFSGEVGLSGEIRPVNRVDQHIQEAEKLGFSIIFTYKYYKIVLKNIEIQVRLVAKIEDVASELFG